MSLAKLFTVTFSVDSPQEIKNLELSLKLRTRVGAIPI